MKLIIAILLTQLALALPAYASAPESVGSGGRAMEGSGALIMRETTWIMNVCVRTAADGSKEIVPQNDVLEGNVYDSNGARSCEYNGNKDAVKKGYSQLASAGSGCSQTGLGRTNITGAVSGKFWCCLNPDKINRCDKDRAVCGLKCAMP